MKLKDNKDCQCGDSTGDSVAGVCRAGYCTVWRCPWCGLVRFDAGPVACPHKKNVNGALRWFKYPEMDTKPRVPVKENTVKRKRAYKKRAWREKM